MSNKQSKIRMGIIGCGKSAHSIHLPALRRVDSIEVIAAADTNRNALQTVADKFSIQGAFIDYRELLGLDEIEAVAVLTPPDSHMEIGLAAMKAGKHVFMDKPLAVDLDHCRMLTEEAGRTKVKTMLGFNFRWHRLLRRAREFITSGELGQIKAIQSIYTHWHPGASAQSWHGKRKYGGGVLHNDGVHHFDLWRFLLNREISEIFSISSPSEFFEDETSAVTAWMDDNIIASGVFSFGSSPESVIDIYGSLGRLTISCYCFDGFRFLSNQTYPGSLSARIGKTVRTIKDLPQTIPALLKGGDFVCAYQDLWNHFAGCIMTGRQPDCTFEDGQKAVEIARAAIESVLTGQKIKVGIPKHII
ncbi:MAG TPA: Gfo/Idh/MocA family oxidoreductase [Syntrophorhabdaceae bacterium]|nr:Gfo/Idh/MocA family oxidoreductase [Syntrophorhabdaceae bacterium]